MPISSTPRIAALAVAATLALVAVPTTPAVAQAGATGALGKGTGPIMTRDELRACFRMQSELERRRGELESQRSALDSEKAAITAENNALSGGRGDVQDFNAKVQAVNAKRTELAARVEDWNQRWQSFEKANRSGPLADRQRKRLLDEQRDLAKQNEALDAEQGDVKPAGAGAAEFNARATSLEQRVKDWNARNAQASEASVKLNDERELWLIECGNRRYLIDDEKAIRGGQ